jgi:predicted kinase
MEMIKSGKDLYIDNTNLTPKRRKFYLNLARQHGYKTKAYVLNTDLETLIARQATRSDKRVPEVAVRQQFASMVGPQQGEFDEVEKVK